MLETHIDLEYHFMKEPVKHEIFKPKGINLEYNMARGYTNPLQRIKREMFGDSIGVNLQKSGSRFLNAGGVLCHKIIGDQFCSPVIT